VDADCPHSDVSKGGLAWRNKEATRTVCNWATNKCIAPPPVLACFTDSGCAPSLSATACSATQGVCVGCVFDSHCGGVTPACDTGRQVCVACTSNIHCNASTPFCHADSRTCATSNAGTLMVGVMAVLVMMISVLV